MFLRFSRSWVLSILGIFFVSMLAISSNGDGMQENGDEDALEAEEIIFESDLDDEKEEEDTSPASSWTKIVPIGLIAGGIFVFLVVYFFSLRQSRRASKKSSPAKNSEKKPRSTLEKKQEKVAKSPPESVVERARQVSKKSSNPSKKLKNRKKLKYPEFMEWVTNTLGMSEAAYHFLTDRWGYTEKEDLINESPKTIQELREEDNVPEDLADYLRRLQKDAQERIKKEQGIEKIPTNSAKKNRKKLDNLEFMKWVTNTLGMRESAYDFLIDGGGVYRKRRPY